MNCYTRVSALSKYIFILLFVFFFLGEANAQLRVSIRKVTDNGVTTIDPWQYPLMKARIRAHRGGIPVKLTKNDILILENNKISKPDEVGDFVNDTTTNEQWQMVKWYTRREGPNMPGNSIIDTFFVFGNNEIAKTAGLFYRADLSYVKVQNFKEEAITEMDFDDVAPGSSQVENLIVKALKGMIDGSGDEGQIWLDSVKVHSNNFRIKWDGWTQDRRPPPLHIWPAMPYFVRLYYEPKDNNYHTDKFSVYYDHGLKQEIMLTGHEFHIADEANNLKLVYPNEKESFTPCQEIVIKWNGYIRGMATYVDFSSNSGASWVNIGSSNDSTLKWKVPNSGTSIGLIRVRQSFNSTNPVLLKVNDIPVYKIAFNYDGSGLLSANEAGVITFWNTVKEKPEKQYFIDIPNYPAQRIRATGLAYTSSDTIFAVAYYRQSDFPRKDSIAFFHTKDSIPFLRTAIAEGFNTAEVHFDNRRRFMAFVPELGMQVKIYSAQDGSFIRDLNYPMPVSAFYFNRDLDQAAVALMDGEIDVLSLPGFTTSNTLDYSDFPQILEMSLAPNGEFLSIGTKAPSISMFSDNRNDIVVINMPTNQVIRRLRRTASDPVGIEFSPISTKLLVGSQDSPQITYWDLPVDESFKGFKGHNGKLTDFAFSPYGSMIATSSASSDNLYLRRFSYAESDESDNFFKIITPSLKIDNVQIPPAFLAESKDYDLNTPLCVNDTSLVFLNVDSLTMKNGTNYSLKKPVPKDTIINNGECLPIHLNYFPLDTGLLADSVIVHSCGKEIVIPLFSRGKMRNLRVLNNTFNFEPTCTGSSLEKVFAFAVNDDPIPVIVSSIEMEVLDGTPFVVMNLRDVLYQPADTIFVTIRFEPKKIGIQSGKLTLIHSNLAKFKLNATVSGEGIGTDYELSHYDLRFIPEILRRKITIHNNSNNEIYIQKADFQPTGYFSVMTLLPITIKPKSESEIEILWNDSSNIPPADVELKLTAGPCAVEKMINIGLYKAYSKITIPDVWADPRNSTTIYVDFKNDENFPYNGERFLDGEITVNPRLFLPQEVKSKYGKGFLVKNEILNDRRIIGFRIEGDFPAEGRAAEIHGVAGLAEIDTSHFGMTLSSIYWGSAVQTSTETGVFHLINICGDRLVIQDNAITNLKLIPNPTDGNLEIEFDSKNPGEFNVEIYNAIGILEYGSGSLIAASGKNNLSLDLKNLKTATYNLMIRQGNVFGTVRLIIIK